jgi:hypothetical protein
MRTTLTLDEDVAAKLKAKSRRLRRPFRVVVNETLRRGLTAQHARFNITARDLGLLRLGVSLDNMSELIEHAEGPFHR